MGCLPSCCGATKRAHCIWRARLPELDPAERIIVPDTRHYLPRDILPKADMGFDIPIYTRLRADPRRASLIQNPIFN